jgi:anti-sigma28 factor (negative regulator of flagellin synthesis)
VWGAAGVKIGFFSRDKDRPDNPDRPDATADDVAGAGDPHGGTNEPQAEHAQDGGTGADREQRVAELREQVREGTYQIPVPQVVRILAARLLNRLG